MQQLQHAMQHRLRLTYREASDRYTGPGTPMQRAFQRAEPKLVVHPALNDGPEGLWGSAAPPRQLLMRCLTAVEPAQSPLHAFAGHVERGLPRNHVVECHRHIRAELPLDLHDLLGGEHPESPVDVALKFDAVLFDAPKPFE